MIGNAPVVFKSKFQRTVVLSSAEAEYMALSLCVQEVLWTRAMLTDMGVLQRNATTIWEDNQGAIAGYHARTKHVDIRHHFIRENVKRGTVKAEYVDTKNQLEDILTKALGTKTLKFLRNGNGIKDKVTAPWNSKKPAQSSQRMLLACPAESSEQPVLQGVQLYTCMGSSVKIVFRCSKFQSYRPGKMKFTIATMGYSTVKCIVPVFYILGTSRSGDSYWDMAHFVVQATDQQLEPAEIVCDFEAALMDFLQTQFPNAIVLGCLFHLKQAFRRAMKRYAIPEEECVIAMTRGVLDTLTVINPTHIARVIKWVKREIKMQCAEVGLGYSALKYNGFWGYFDRTWIKSYPIEVWNVYGMNNELIARTNNPLGRFNRELN
ncbi:unnamed protein product [Phytophthora fragariaefolia]|uniref:Unnamed protein product n=1 Tax=Phytophthora fragariaefolia TaxID=1490495 RepID=A0A9W6YA17_9STRA|nr:unnamed protein product [Phytophthora fragariaefolia]